jgi:hypothetical protein
MALISRNSYIFIHIYKCAGMSIRKVLTDNLSSTEFQASHDTAEAVRNGLYVHNEKFFWDTSFKFSFVRNPFDWVVSLYEFIRQNESHPNYHEVAEMDFEYFCKWNVDSIKNREDNSNGSFHTLSDFLFDGTSGELLVNFVGKLETFEEDCSKIFDVLKISYDSIPYINRTPSRNKDYRSYYTPACRSIVSDGFYYDLVNFDYKY